jgi:hypothetical protein
VQPMSCKQPMHLKFRSMSVKFYCVVIGEYETSVRVYRMWYKHNGSSKAREKFKRCNRSNNQSAR